MDYSIFDKFSTHSKNALKTAFSVAMTYGHRTVTPQHVLYGLCMEKGSIAYQILLKAKIQSFEIKRLLEQLPAKRKVTQLQLGPEAKKLIERSFLIASEYRHHYIGTEHLLNAIIASPDKLTDYYLQQKGADRADIKKQIDNIFKSTAKFPEITAKMGQHEPDNLEQDSIDQPEINTINTSDSLLEMFATNLTSKDVQQTIDPVIGREDEIERMIQILSRRTKNNPLLLGDPGVGKTALVEGLAKKILYGDVPDVLRNKKIYNLDLSLVVAGTSFRGEFENRLKKIISEIKNDPDSIVFIDEIHNIIGVGSATGSMDAANILKPALARGTFRCIGATTTEDYKKHIESDPALERRFQTIAVSQPTPEKTIKILNGIKENYEFYHQVAIEPEAITAAVYLSERYISDKFLPDKAIDLIDEAAAAAKVKNTTGTMTKKIIELQNQLSSVTEKKQIAVSKEKFSQALKYRNQQHLIIEKLQALKDQQSLIEVQKNISIGRADIAKIVSRITGIPVADFLAEETKKLITLEKRLAKKIIGQHDAVKGVSEIIRRSRAGISDPKRPLGSFIFLGPSGVGKTELARQLAEQVFGSTESLIKIDMSEFAESFNISKLIGAPAGYVGYKENSKLTDAVKRRPYSVVLFDEIEKAHRQIFNLFLQILEDGYLTDATGKKINFRNTVIIMTSNIGAEKFNRYNALGFSDSQNPHDTFEKTKEMVLSKLKDEFPPEFLSRIDKTFVFEPLAKRELQKIARAQLFELKKRLAQKDIDFLFDSLVIKHLSSLHISPEIGARAIRKNIQDLVENEIAISVLQNSKPKSKKISVTVLDNAIKII